MATMKVGELCQLVCKPEYAYGSAGSPPKIPPNATLIFEVYTQFVLVSKCIKCCAAGYSRCQIMCSFLKVELFEFRGEDITDDEDGGIIRRIITKGEGYSKPNEGAVVEGNGDGNV